MVHTIHLSLVLFSVIHGKLAVYAGDNRLPSRPLGQGEKLDEALSALLSEILGTASNIYVEQLYTTGDPVEQGSIVVVYIGLLSQDKLPTHVRGSMCAIVDERLVQEKEIVRYAVQRLQWKIEYTNVAYSLLPSVFAFGELQRAYEAILGRSMDKRNFRKKIFSLNILKDIGQKRTHGRSRPAELYAFKKRKPTIVEIL